MFQMNQLTRVAGLATSAALALSLTAMPASAMDDESYWYAKGDQSLPDGQLWANSYGECWQSAYPDGPTNLPPCDLVVPEEFTLRLNFEFDKYRMENVVNREEVARLDDYIADVKASPADEYLTVVGHTDSVGSQAYNYGLGMRRATTVRDYMINQGLPASRIGPAESRGKLEMLPEYPTDSVMQRRVVIHSRGE
ncbi:MULTISPECIES: OmpA family protein [Thiorhodovibrio]|jgi:OOP family OmpA-OmpF porin|uniref:OmpA family protein n=1 Tax=Thiorhodovibrio TaxID=61593 RepID=UPI0019118635|nr:MULTISPECIES: OmpA family protein [Thiorhodovibrio]MBK5967707.1 flagellar motor protein MotB [Thiorhodovibrio winogradskyi]WPL11655.1 Outer membrane protein II* [Thiorhodovibrio litoralis]